MFRNFSTGFLLICLFIHGCKKPDEDYCIDGYIIDQQHSLDTIYPSEYLAAYPGSWWEYSDGTIDTCLAWEKTAMWNSSDNPENTDCPIVVEDMVYLPSPLFYHYGHIYGNRATSIIPNLFTSGFTALVDTNVGIIYQSVRTYDVEVGNAHDTITFETVARLPEMVVNGTSYQDVVHMQYTRKVYYSHIAGGPTFLNHFYYAKHVGLVKHSVSFTYEDRELVNYYIAPH